MNVIAAVLLVISPLVAQSLEPSSHTSPGNTKKDLSSSNPPPVQICGATNSTPMQISTCAPNGGGRLEPAAHGLASNCGAPDHTCYVRIAGVVSDVHGGPCPSKLAVVGRAGATYADGMFAVKYIDATTLELDDTAGTPAPVASNVRFCDGGTVFSRRGAAWVGQLEPAILGPTDLWPNGPRGAEMSGLSPTHGMAATNSVRADGCPKCYITVTLADTGYDPLTSPPALAAGDNFSVFGTVTDLSVNGPAMKFGQPTSSWYDEFDASQYVSADFAGATRVLRWSSANRGAWPLAYGDQSSTYAHMCANSAGSYLATWQVASSARCITDFTHSGWDHFAIEQDEVFLNRGHSEPIQRDIHYPQNGSRIGSPEQSGPTRRTSCIDSQARQVPCSDLTTADRVMSTEDGAGSRKRPFGVLTQIYSPRAISLQWDGPGVGGATQRTATNAYVAGHGLSDRVTITGGDTIGASVSGFETVIIHKIMNGPLDKALISLPLNPNTAWTGGEACGAISCVAYLGNRGSLQQFVPSFTTSASSVLPYQYLISGLNAGIYEVSIGGTLVLGSPFNVLDRNNSIEFEGAAGLVTIEPVLGPPNTSVGSLSLASILEASVKNGGAGIMPKPAGTSHAISNSAKGSAAVPRSTNSLSPFTVDTCGSRSLPCDYSIVGVPPGTYTVTIGGRPLWGAPLTVHAGDTTMWFEGGPGTVEISPALLVKATMVAIIVTGKRTLLAHGSSEQLTAMGTYSDGSAADLTDQVTWVSSAAKVASISALGVVTAVAIGQARISATLNDFSSDLDLTVMPPRPCDGPLPCREH